MSRRFLVGPEDSGRRLDVWLAGRSDMSRSEVQRLVDSRAVKVDGRSATKSLRLRGGQTVEVTTEPEPLREVAPVDFAVRFEDEHLAVVSKPAGVVVHPAPGARSPSLVEALARVMPLAPAAGELRPGVVHRLDKTTSGLLVFAKHDEAYAALVESMRAREIKRSYLALVAGVFRLPRGRIEAPMGRSPRDPTRMGVVPSGRDAVTEFRVAEPVGAASLIEVSLVTGRTHQVRVHLSHIGHPVIGDRVYGRSTEAMARKLGLARPFLHATSLRFTHPLTGREIAVTDDLPDDLARALARAREIGARP